MLSGRALLNIRRNSRKIKHVLLIYKQLLKHLPNRQRSGDKTSKQNHRESTQPFPLKRYRYTNKIKRSCKTFSQ